MTDQSAPPGGGANRLLAQSDQQRLAFAKRLRRVPSKKVRELLLALAGLAHDGQTVKASQADIAQAMGCSPKTIARRQRNAVELGVLSVEHANGTINEYVIDWSAVDCGGCRLREQRPSGDRQAELFVDDDAAAAASQADAVSLGTTDADPGGESCSSAVASQESGEVRTGVFRLGAVRRLLQGVLTVMGSANGDEEPVDRGQPRTMTAVSDRPDRGQNLGQLADRGQPEGVTAVKTSDKTADNRGHPHEDHEYEPHDHEDFICGGPEARGAPPDLETDWNFDGRALRDLEFVEREVYPLACRMFALPAGEVTRDGILAAACCAIDKGQVPGRLFTDLIKRRAWSLPMSARGGIAEKYFDQAGRRRREQRRSTAAEFRDSRSIDAETRVGAQADVEVAQIGVGGSPASFRTKPTDQDWARVIRTRLRGLPPERLKREIRLILGAESDQFRQFSEAFDLGGLELVPDEQLLELKLAFTEKSN